MIPFFYMSYMKKRFSIPFGFEKRFLLFCIDVPILIRPGAVTIVCVSDPICVTIIIISVCCFYYINSTVTVKETTNGDYYYCDADGVGYTDNGDGTWTDENGNIYTE